MGVGLGFNVQETGIGVGASAEVYEKQDQVTGTLSTAGECECEGFTGPEKEKEKENEGKGSSEPKTSRAELEKRWGFDVSKPSSLSFLSISPLLFVLCTLYFSISPSPDYPAFACFGGFLFPKSRKSRMFGLDSKLDLGFLVLFAPLPPPLSPFLLPLPLPFPPPSSFTNLHNSPSAVVLHRPLDLCAPAACEMSDGAGREVRHCGFGGAV